MSPSWQQAYTAAYMRDPAKRARRNELARQRSADPANRDRIEARRAVRYALLRGEITRLPCEVCGETKSEAHHPDYSKPLLVVWLCRPHHREQHPRSRKPLPGRPPLVTTCRNGHPYDNANTYEYRGERRCRACNAAAVARRKLALQAKAEGQ